MRTSRLARSPEIVTQARPTGPAHSTAAVARVRRGMDSADALHLAKARGCEAFFTFDQNSAVANVLSDVKVRAS
jgi:predicted nucleic acid-binding protein